MGSAIELSVKKESIIKQNPFAIFATISNMFWTTFGPLILWRFMLFWSPHQKVKIHRIGWIFHALEYQIHPTSAVFVLKNLDTIGKNVASLRLLPPTYLTFGGYVKIILCWKEESWNEASNWTKTLQYKVYTATSERLDCDYNGHKDKNNGRWNVAKYTVFQKTGILQKMTRI